MESPQNYDDEEVCDTPPESQNYVQETPLENIPTNTCWYCPVEETKNSSTNVMEFYHNGDASSSISFFVGKMKLGQEFWGSLLGYQNYSYLSTLHVKGWVTRLMRFCWKEITKKHRPEQLFPWTIMPPQFYNILCETPNNGALPFSIGMKEEYPALWDVDTVYIPIRIEDIHWLLLWVEMYVYLTENCDPAIC
ncbi:hypothetical protein R6Q57_008673 [Mikania cordata]